MLFRAENFVLHEQSSHQILATHVLDRLHGPAAVAGKIESEKVNTIVIYHRHFLGSYYRDARMRSDVL